jgi:hypothetical protein
MSTDGGIELTGGVGYAQARSAGRAGGTGPPPLPGPRRWEQGAGMRTGGGARRLVAARPAAGPPLRPLRGDQHGLCHEAVFNRLRQGHRE